MECSEDKHSIVGLQCWTWIISWRVIMQTISRKLSWWTVRLKKLFISSYIMHPTYITNFFLIVMRGDIARLGRCTSICTQGEDTIRRSKPFKYAYEKEIVMYVFWLLGCDGAILINSSLIIGTHTLKSLITSLPSVSIPLMPTGGTPGLS